MSRRNGSQVVTITTLGQRPSTPPGRRIGLGGAIATGFAVLLAYLVVTALLHLIGAVFVWLPAMVAAGYATRVLGRRGVPGWPRLFIGVVVLILVHTLLIAGLRAIGL